MFSYIWNTFFFDPIYNLLIFFLSIVREGDLGIAIILTVLVVKIILLPLSIKAVKTQKVMREIEPKLKAVREQYKDDKETQMQETLKIYREAGMNPLSVLFNLLIQFPILIALYFSIYSGYSAASEGVAASFSITSERLYSFVTAPAEFTTNFLGIVDILEPSIILALLAGISAYIQISLSLPPLPPRDTSDTAQPDFKEEFTRNMQGTMRYVMPVMMFGIGYFFSAVIALYFVVSNVTSIAQEFLVRRHR